jgi:hypothetical protein
MVREHLELDACRASVFLRRPPGAEQAERRREITAQELAALLSDIDLTEHSHAAETLEALAFALRANVSPPCRPFENRSAVSVASDAGWGSLLRILGGAFAAKIGYFAGFPRVGSALRHRRFWRKIWCFESFGLGVHLATMLTKMLCGAESESIYGCNVFTTKTVNSERYFSFESTDRVS